jgi:hypothetical protein
LIVNRVFIAATLAWATLLLADALRLGLPWWLFPPVAIVSSVAAVVVTVQILRGSTSRWHFWMTIAVGVLAFGIPRPMAFAMFAVGLLVVAKQPEWLRPVAGAVGIVAALGIVPVQDRIRAWDFSHRRPALDRVVGDVQSDPDITMISDFRVNDTFLDETGATPARPPAPARLRQVLEQEQIEESTYRRIVDALADNGFTHVDVDREFVVFVESSFLDNVSGVLYAPDGMRPPAVGERLIQCDVTSMDPLSGGWYRFTTT